ncbi:DUF6389 family protein [Curvivirga aplysinae]|uniref:DUF6389 family protein n=1 Tax=Curvivirga aplysinae TaxID=2529852 RepID=UPI0012BBD8A3|nr:DUF6389 family protein [Curvivirga aplysinae]MTI08903.1 hypothetical protein [Curvivirga aplysinae]
MSIDKASYQSELLQAMISCNNSAIQNINNALTHWPAKATGIGFDTFIDQDEEGFVSILLTPQGPDSYVLNKQVRDFRYLFDIKFIDGQLNFPVTLFDPNEAFFDMREAVSETALKWVLSLIKQIGEVEFPKPIIFSNCYHEAKILHDACESN